MGIKIPWDKTSVLTTAKSVHGGCMSKWTKVLSVDMRFYTYPTMPAACIKFTSHAVALWTFHTFKNFFFNILHYTVHWLFVYEKFNCFINEKLCTFEKCLYVCTGWKLQIEFHQFRPQTELFCGWKYHFVIFLVWGFCDSIYNENANRTTPHDHCTKIELKQMQNI